MTSMGDTMRKFLIALAIVYLMVAAFTAGHVQGVRHAICDSEVYFTELTYEDGDLPTSADFRLWIELDGEVYEHFGYIG